MSRIWFCVLLASLLMSAQAADAQQVKLRAAIQLPIAAGSPQGAALVRFQEEVELFLHLQVKGADWWPRETTTGELVSLLLGLCARVDKVALDPLPSLGKREIIGLVSTGRRHFVRHLMGEDTAYPERKNLSGRESGPYAPTPLRRSRTRPAQSAARQ